VGTVSQAMKGVWSLILEIVAAVIWVIAVVEAFLHRQLASLGVHGQLQSVILIVAAVILALVAFRALAGLLRLLFVLLLILFAVHVAMPLVRP